MTKSDHHPNDFKTLAILEEILFSITGKRDLESLESEYLNTITHLIPAHATAFYVLKPGKFKPMRINARGVDRDFLHYYENHGRELDPLRRWITRQKAPNQSQVLLGLKGWQHHPVYNIVGTASIDYAMQSPIVFGQDVVGTLNFGRDLHEGPFTTTDLKCVSIVSKFLSMAIGGLTGDNDKSDIRTALCNTINDVHHGIVITDADYSIQYANTAAKRHVKTHRSQSDVCELIKQNAQYQGKFGGFDNNDLSAKFCPVPGSENRHSIVFMETEKPLVISSELAGLLTEREIDVLKLIDKGMSNKKIAHQLKISVNTVKRHLDNLYGKLQVNSRTQLISRVYKIISGD